MFHTSEYYSTIGKVITSVQDSGAWLIQSWKLVSDCDIFELLGFKLSNNFYILNKFLEVNTEFGLNQPTADTHGVEGPSEILTSKIILCNLRLNFQFFFCV